MKKKGLIIASLMVLVLSVFFMGCPPPDDGNDWDLSDGATKALADIGYTKTVPGPVGTTFDDFKAVNNNKVVLAWTGGDQEKFTAYAKALGVRGVTPEDSVTLTNVHLGDGFSGQVYLANGDGGEESGLSVKPNAIVLVINKNP